MPTRSNCPIRGGIPIPRRSSPSRVSKTGSVSMMSASIRPGTATISVTFRDPRRATARWTTRSTLAATVGTTKRAEMFSPARSGNVQALVKASRALLACSVHMPGSPELRASSRSRHSSARTSPTINLLGHAWDAKATVGEKHWDTLFAAIVEHEFTAAGRPAPSWSHAEPLDEEWIPAKGRLDDSQVRKETPNWLAAKNILLAESALAVA